VTPRERELRDEATHELTARLLGDAARDVGLALAKSLAADSARALGDAEAKAAIALLEPHLGRALAKALDARRPDDELGTPEVAAALGLSRRGLEKLLAANRSPLGFARARKGGPAVFRRADLDAFVDDGESAPADDGVDEQLVAVLRRNLPPASPAHPSRLMRVSAASALLGLLPAQLYYEIGEGRVPLRTRRVGRRVLVLRRDVEAFLAARAANPTKET
jgi:predicted DNA-binding transcriptional regulator AlpA